MNDENNEIQKVVVLWLSGAHTQDILDLPGVVALKEAAAAVELVSSPITGPQSLHYQVLSGRAPAGFGFFDTLVPLCHLSRTQQGADGYQVAEEYAGRDTVQLLPDKLRAANWIVEYKELSSGGMLSYMREVAGSTPTLPTCIVLKCAIEEQPLLPSIAKNIDTALQVARTWIGPDGLLALLSDHQPAQIRSFVNVNNFLAEMGVIERDEQSGSINWSDSLAYFAGNGQLWVNLLGREPHGAVHPQDEYEEVRDTLRKAIPHKLRDAETGEEVIAHIYLKEELYPTNYLFCAPDLVVAFKPGYAPSPNSKLLGFDKAVTTQAAPGSTAASGVHPSLLKGFLMVAGPAFQQGAFAQKEAPVTSVAPTLLHALGLVYAESDSQAISEIFTPSYLEKHPIRAATAHEGLSDEDEELVINRLRDLGYV